MNTEKTFYIVYYAKKHKKHITRLGKHDEKSRYGTSKKGVPYYVYYDLVKHGSTEEQSILNVEFIDR